MTTPSPALPRPAGARRRGDVSGPKEKSTPRPRDIVRVSRALLSTRRRVVSWQLQHARGGNRPKTIVGLCDQSLRRFRPMQRADLIGTLIGKKIVVDPDHRAAVLCLWPKDAAEMLGSRADLAGEYRSRRPARQILKKSQCVGDDDRCRISTDD